MRRPRRLAPLVLTFGLLLAAGAGSAAHAAEKLKIEVDGVSGNLKRNVLATLSLEEARQKRKKELTEELIRRLHAKAPDEIGTALQPFGYYRPQVQSTLEREGTTWVARYRIDAGPQLFVTSLDLKVDGPGASDPGFTERVQSFPLRKGAPLFHPAYEVGKQSLVDYAAAEGYLDAEYKVNQIRIDQAAYTCDVVLHFDTGPRYLFGPVRFHQDFLDPALLRGYVNFKEGETLNVNKLLEMQTSLSGSPYFQRVEVLPREEEAKDLEVPIDVDLVPSKPQRWHFGLGYGTDTGPRGTASLELRHINREGHHFLAETTVSEIDKSFSSSYQIPGAYPRTDVISFDAGYAFLNPKTSESRIFKISSSLSQSIGIWRQSLSLGFQHEGFTIGLDKGTSHLLIPDASWSLVRADNRIYTTHGQKVQIDLRGADSSVLSNATFVQEKVEGIFIRSFAQRFRFISRAQVGDTQTNDFHELPPTIRFFAGGDQSVRGYAYQQLGDKDANGHVIGGKALMTGSVEVDYTYLEHWKFLDKWGVAAFFDAGNATSSLSTGVLEHGAGLGLRWVSPVGPVHLDFARALTQPGHPLRIHFTIGPDL